MEKTHNKALIVSLKANGRNKKTNVTIFMKKLADFIINVKQVFKSIKIYLMKYKLLSHLYNHSKCNSWHKDTVFGV